MRYSVLQVVYAMAETNHGEYVIEDDPSPRIAILTACDKREGAADYLMKLWAYWQENEQSRFCRVEVSLEKLTIARWIDHRIINLYDQPYMERVVAVEATISAYVDPFVSIGGSLRPHVQVR